MFLCVRDLLRRSQKVSCRSWCPALSCPSQGESRRQAEQRRRWDRKVPSVGVLALLSDSIQLHTTKCKSAGALSSRRICDFLTRFQKVILRHLVRSCMFYLFRSLRTRFCQVVCVIRLGMFLSVRDFLQRFQKVSFRTWFPQCLAFRKKESSGKLSSVACRPSLNHHENLKK